MLRCSIAGLGRIGSTLEDDPLREKPASHAGAISAHPDCLLLSGCDIDPEKRAAFAQRWPCGEVFPSLEALLDHQLPDILHIATPTPTHLSLLLTAFARRVPVVVLEKPVAPTLSVARRMLGANKKSPTIVIVNHERRYSRDYQYARTVLSSAKHGRLLSCTARLYMGTDLVAMLWEDGTHMVDILMFLLGSPLWVKRARRQGQAVFVELQSNIVDVRLEASCLFDHLVFEVDLGFERGRLVVGNGVLLEYASRESPFYQDFRSLAVINDYRPGQTGYFAQMFEDAVHVCHDFGRGADQKTRSQPISSLADGVSAVCVLSNIIRRI